MSTTGKVRRWSYGCLVAVELMVVMLLVAGGCYSKQNYQVLSPQNGDELLRKRNVVVEGQVVRVMRRQRESWLQNISQIVFFCWYNSGAPEGPIRYDVFIEIDRVLKGDPTMPRRLRVNNCRPLTDEETVLFSQAGDAFPNNIRVRIAFEHQHGNSLSGLIVVPIEGLAAPTTQSAPATQRQLPRSPSAPQHPEAK